VQTLQLTDSQFDPSPYWEVPLDSKHPIPYVVSDLFDQNGYDLSRVEQLYAYKNEADPKSHRTHRIALKNDWMTQPYKEEGAVLNHALLFERKGYRGRALTQLQEWARMYPVFYKLINIKPKWGLDFSIDYYDKEANTFEVLHWEYDCFDYQEALDKKYEVEENLIRIDWDSAARELLKLKDQWYTLDFFRQSDFKCNFFGIGSERWKMVVWE